VTVRNRPLIETEDERRARLRHLEQLTLLAGVAMKALAMGRAPEAERLLAPAVADFQTFAERASAPDEWEVVARMHSVMATILPRLEAATGKPWTRCLEVVKHKSWMPRLPPRGRS
jgi:hypothetical protein